MQKATFRLSEPDALPLEALRFLEKAHKQNPSTDDDGLFEVINSSYNYVVSLDRIVGAVSLSFHETVMSVTLCGGENINLWKDDLWEFLMETMKTHGMEKMIVIGRYGWGRMFRKFEPYGMIYVYNGVHCEGN